MLVEELQQAIFKAGFDTARDFCEIVASALVSTTKEKVGNIAVDLNLGFKKYLDTHIKRFSKIKTLINRHEPADFLSIYVNPDIKVENKQYNESAFIDYLLDKRLIIIAGAAGCGKSMLLKRLFLSFLERSRGYIPLFFALREIEKDGVVRELKDCLFNELKTSVKKLTPQQYEHGLNAGKFLLLLDGLDEVDPNKRPVISQQIIELSRAYPHLVIICTSRPNEAFIDWNEFSVGTIEAFRKNKVLKLIKNAPYDEEAKKRFSEQVEKNLFETHSTFLSNPLLCTMMLLTYDEQKEIPGKMYLFYSAAYEALSARHDRSKGYTFKRKFYSGIEPEDFRKVFCTFCTALYLAKKLTISNYEGQIFAKKALELHGINATAQQFLDDLTESVCILARDGLFFSFIHRSFQEYFVAVYAVERYSDQIFNIIELALSRHGDEVVPLFFEINKEAFEQKYLKRKLFEVINEIETIGIDRNPSRVFGLFYLGISIGDPDDDRSDNFLRFTVGNNKGRGKLYDFTNMCSKFYRKPHAWPNDKFDWKAWGVSHKNKSTDREGFDFDDVCDEILVGTPLVSMLHRMLTDFKTLSKTLDAEEIRQDSIFSAISPN
jgi:hypothetical protein